jgi:hypothetical protein
MPIIPPVTAAPYDTAEYVLDLARAIANDAALTIEGNLLADDQPYTYVLLNQAWRTLQRKLANAGYERLLKEAVLTGFAPVVTANPALQVYFNWTEYNNGSNPYTSPVLPQDCILPLRLWERPTGTASQFVPMQPVNDGLPSVNQTAFFQVWDWRDDKVVLIGAVQQNDIRMRYAAYLPDITQQESGTTIVPIMRCADALANYLVWAFARARGSPLANQFMVAGDDCTKQILTYTARKRQRGSHRRKPYGYG